MNTQINLRLPEKLLSSAKTYAKNNGYGNVQELIKETLREKLFDYDPDFNKEELELIQKIIEVTKKHNLYCTEEELMKKLRER